jgi:hypothetical protein
MANRKLELTAVYFFRASRRIRERINRLLSRRNAFALTAAATALFVFGDFGAPGEINVSIFYALSVALAS